MAANIQMYTERTLLQHIKTIKRNHIPTLKEGHWTVILWFCGLIYEKSYMKGTLDFTCVQFSTYRLASQVRE
jgi:hypothetical protein